MNRSYQDDLRLIEAGFPCHQVGAETQRERDTGKAPPPNRLHVWWARRPLTPSRAAILASLLPADTDPDWFIKQLGVLKKIVEINGVQWVLVGKFLDKLLAQGGPDEKLTVDKKVREFIIKENERRSKCREIIKKLKTSDESFYNDVILKQWEKELVTIPAPLPSIGEKLDVQKIPANPSWVNDLIQFAKSPAVVKVLGKSIKLAPEDLYGYGRAFSNPPQPEKNPKVVLDPTSGGGSIPFEALRLGHQVIANDLNPVACVILNATLRYPAQFGPDLLKDIEYWGKRLTKHVSKQMEHVTPFSKLPEHERVHLKEHCRACPEHVSEFDTIEYDQTGILYCRQVTCPHCGGDAPLLNTCWLSKQAGKQWGVKIIPDGKSENGTVSFETYRAEGGKGPKGEDPDFATVNRGVGLCVHCKQAISADEIKAQARGESSHGEWKDRLYCIVAVRFQPKLDKNGKIQRYKSGAKKGEVKTEKVRFFRIPNAEDFKALKEAERELSSKWDHWDEQGLIPTEKIPLAHKTKEPLRVGMTRWCDMFTPRQLLGHLTLMEEMFTHKSQDAWEALTKAIIESGWIITASFPVESETQQGFHTKDTASAISSVFISCRKRSENSTETATWSGFGGTGVQQKIRDIVKQGLKDFMSLRLNPVDEMVASYGKALSVLSEQWPVLDGDEPVGPIRAMNEASRVVAENQISRITDGQLTINDLLPEASMALTLYGIYGLGELPYDEALNLSRSLNIKLATKTGGYSIDDQFIGINNDSSARRNQQRARAEEIGFHAPLIRKGSKLRLAMPEERNPKRVENPQTEWDILHGLIVQYRKGDIPLVRAYISRHAEGKEDILVNLLSVWTAEMGDENLKKEGNNILFGIK